MFALCVTIPVPIVLFVFAYKPKLVAESVVVFFRSFGCLTKIGKVNSLAGIGLVVGILITFVGLFYGLSGRMP